MQTMLDVITHPLLADLRHGFFTRKGGASSGLYAGLNCGRGSGDMPSIVAVNRGRVAQWMGAPLASVHQTHSARVVTIREGDDPADLVAQAADGIVTARPGIALAVLTADCQPVLLADPEAGVIGVAHAGWRGARDGILEAVIEAMMDAGAERVRAVIGPTISQRAYEVGPEFVDDLLVGDPENARFFASGPHGRPHFDLPAYGLHRLREAGAEAEWTRHCTWSDEARFFSYRRATQRGEQDYGRLMSAIVL